MLQFSTSQTPNIGYEYNPSLGDLTPQREEELINLIARQIIKNGFENIAELFIGALKNYGYPIAHLTLLPIAGLFDVFGINAFEYVELFRETRNAERLLELLRNPKLDM